MNQALRNRFEDFVEVVDVKPELMSKWTGFEPHECRIFLRKFGKEASTDYNEYYRIKLS